ncbi:MAG: sulfatase-like hydrolase/transferase [Methylococcales bacterium]
MNFVLIMTDTQNKSMVGAYGIPAVDTPNLDRLAATGIRFERAYTACPLCTPARGAIFSGLHPQVNGAWCNNIAPQASVALMGTIFRHFGYRAAYTGKWHLDGSSYWGTGLPDGGFEPDWWYDGKRYAEEIGPEMLGKYITCRTADELRAAGFGEEKLWGHRVASRAIDFLERVDDAPFLLAVSFDEPHAPFVAPPDYWEKFTPADIPKPPNYNAPVDNKPWLQQVQRRQNGDVPWEEYAAQHTLHFGCNSYIDREIGRVIDAVENIHGADTAILYTSDHGDMLGAHGLRSKGPMMYQEICNIPFIVRMPDGPSAAISQALISHLDIIPTMLDLAGIDVPPKLHGVSQVPVLRGPSKRVRDTVTIGFHRFAINYDQYGEYYPIRCITDGRCKLAINLLDSDELYDLVKDPYETDNLIDHSEYDSMRASLHEALLAEMDRIRDPLRSFRWGDRPWHRVREAFYWGGEDRPPPQGFPFEPAPPMSNANV